MASVAVAGQTIEQPIVGTGSRLAPKLELTRVIRTSRDKVFAAWTQPELMLRWFGPGNMVARAVELDVREGGKYSWELWGSMQAPTAEEFESCTQRRSSVSGTYLNVVPNELLQFTWKPGWAQNENSVVTVTLRDVVGGTEVTLLHERFVDNGSCEGHNQGWMACLAKLAALLNE